MKPIFVAIDTPDLERAVSIAKAVRDEAGGVKLGLEFFSAQGPDGYRRIAQLGLPIFLDLKLHDIPNTVAKAVEAIARAAASDPDRTCSGWPRDALGSESRSPGEDQGGCRHVAHEPG